MATSQAAVAQNAAIPAAPCTVPQAAKLSLNDVQRLAGLINSRTRGLAEAMRAQSSADRAYVSDLFARGLQPVLQMARGDYRCRTIKLGGLGPVVIYSWFRCRIEMSGENVRLEKITGSQNFTGTLLPTTGGGMLFKGAGHYGYEGPRAYGADPERDIVGCLTRVPGTAERYILEEPQPVFESTHDVIELVPAR